jgi:hypothetical protein
MQVRDLQGWPPKWRGASSVSGHVAHGERGVLIAVHWDLKKQSFTLAMEDEGDRYSAVLEDDARVAKRLYLLLGWHIGRPLASIGRLEMSP